MSTFWSVWIIFFTVATFAGIVWLMWGNRSSLSRGSNVSTGHNYDGIEEYDTPTPAWFTVMFILLTVFAAGYLVFYPGLGSYPGLLGWTSADNLAKQEAAAEAEYGPIFARYGAMSVQDLLNEPQALAMGQRLFANHCAQCHGVDARGAYGFPNLTDDDWLWGGSPERIRETITEGRIANMMAWGSTLGDRGVQQVSAYVVTLSGREADPGLAEPGAILFQQFCSSCHGVEGKGNYMLGAPNLTDDIWLYGGSFGQIQQTVRNGRQGQMPAQKDLLGKDEIQLLTAYVYSLSRDR